MNTLTWRECLENAFWDNGESQADIVKASPPLHDPKWNTEFAENPLTADKSDDEVTIHAPYVRLWTERNIYFAGFDSHHGYCIRVEPRNP